MSNGINIPHFEEFLSDLLNSFIRDPQIIGLVNEKLSGILHNLKTKAVQGVEQYVTKQLIPELSRRIQSFTGVPVEPQLMLLRPFISRGLATFLEQGRVLDKNEIIQMAKRSFPELVITTVIPKLSEYTKTVAKVIAAVTTAFCDNELTAQKYKVFEKALKDALSDAVLPGLKIQLMGAVDRFLDCVENMPGIKQDATSLFKILVQVLTPYFPNEFLRCLESAFEEAITTWKRSSRKILKKTVQNTANRVADHIQNASLSTSFSDIHHFKDFLTDLLKCFSVGDLVNEIKNELSGILHHLKTKAVQGVDQYVTKQLIPELSRRIQSFTGVPVEPQLMLLRPFISRGLATFLEQGRVPDKNEIIQMAKTSFPELVITAVIPKASEHTKTLVRNVLNLVQEAVFAPGPGTTPSLETLLKTLYEKCADKVFCIDKEKLGRVIDILIERIPDAVDGIMEFLIKHVLPAMSAGCFEVDAFALVEVFLHKSCERLRKEGRVRGRDLARPLATKALKLASTQVTKNTAGEVSKMSTTVVKQAVTKNKVTHKLVQKCVVDKAGGKVVVETTKKAAVKSSKTVVEKVTQNAGSKTVTTASQVTAKKSVEVTSKAVKSVSDKAINSVGGKATQQGVRVAGSKTVQKASVKVTGSISEGISNGVTEVTKKAAVKKTTKTAVTETAETITTTTTTKVTKESVSKTTHISQTSSKAAAEVGMKNAAKAGLTAAGISAAVGGVFLYCDLKDLDKQKENGSIKATEYKEQKAQRIGEFAGDVIGSGIVGAAVSVAALTGPVGWAAIGVGAAFSFATGKLGGKIGKALA